MPHVHDKNVPGKGATGLGDTKIELELEIK
ncbi:hypothetical protein M2145_002972 [Lachnospiraceae bacterium PF1-21]